MRENPRLSLIGRKLQLYAREVCYALGMSETSPARPKLFQLPERDNYQLPPLKKCDMENVPREVHEQIYHQRATDEVAKSTLLGSPLNIDFGEAGRVFVLAYHQQKTLDGYPSKDYAVYTVDIGQNGELMGYGLSLLELDAKNQEVSEPPFLRYTYTPNNFRGQGLATRRLIVLNEANKSLFKHFLSSGSSRQGAPAAEGAWQSLVAKGFAVEGENGNYRFIK